MVIDLEEKEPHIDEDRIKKAEDIIKNHVMVAMGIGTVPVPIVDFVGLTTTQMNMIRKLAQLYKIEFSKDIVKSSIISLLGGYMAIPTAIGFASLIKFIPIIGQSAGAVSMTLTGAGTTYAVGQVFINHFESGGTFLDFDHKKAKEYFGEQFKKGKKFATNLRKKEENKEEAS